MDDNAHPTENAYELENNAHNFLTGLKVDQNQVKLLRKSKILTVYAVFKDRQNIESIIWGLAEKRKTKAPFHWIADLKDDISVLLN